MTCSNCKGEKSYIPISNKLGLGATILLIVLPKCPFCLLAFGSTIAMCGVKDVASHENRLLTFGLVSLFIILVLISILKKAGRRNTAYSIVLTMVGFSILSVSIFLYDSFYLYYPGVGIILLGIWLNGSLVSFMNFIKNIMYPSVIRIKKP